MIQFKRGTTRNWKNKILASGQPGYDKTKNKLKIGDGTKEWEKLDYLVGELDTERLLQAEQNANDKTIFTYGKRIPTNKTKGEIYFQQFDGAIETDYVVEIGRNVNYFFRKWNSGFIECWGKGEIPKNINDNFTKIIFNVKNKDYFELKGFWK